MKPYSLKDTPGLLVAALFSIAQLSAGHSWPESARRIGPDGTFVGDIGFPRFWDNVTRDTNMYKVEFPNNTTPLVEPRHAVINKESNNATIPMLKASPGDWVAVRYLENGHVSLAETLLKEGKKKPINRGTIYLYGTKENDLSNFRLMDVHQKWTPEGTGGDKKGRLLATRHYDDGQCFEVIGETGDPEGIKAFRNANFPNPVNQIPCQSDIKLPDDLPIGKPYTVLWVWDWPLLNQVGVAVPPPTFPKDPKLIGATEIYVGIVDIMIVDPCDASLGEVKGSKCAQGGPKEGVQFVQNIPDFSQVAIRRQMENLFMVKLPEQGTEMKDGINYNISDIPFIELIDKQQPPFPLPNEWQTNAKNRLLRAGSSGNTGGGSGGASSSAAPAPTASAIPTAGPPPGGGGAFLSASSAAPPPAASSAPVASASQASAPAPVPTSIPATASQVSSASAPASTNKPTGESSPQDIKILYVTQTISVPVTTVYVTDTVTTLVATATVYESAANQTASAAPKFRRGKGQWGFVGR